MKSLILLIIFTISLFASSILNYNIYNRTDRVDIMITFDTPYNEKVIKHKAGQQLIIKLQNTTIESPKFKRINSKFVKSIKIVQVGSYTQIIAKISPSTKLLVSKTSDGYGLRLRFKEKSVTKNRDTINNSLTTLPTKKETQIPTSYIIVVSLLFIGVIVLFFINKKVKLKTDNQPSWLFKNNKPTKLEKNSNEISISFRKKLDKENSVIMIDYQNRSYLILSGRSNILLDTFIDNKPVSQEEFDSILKNKTQELDEFLKVENSKLKLEDDLLKAYKEKAARLMYSEENN